MAKLKHSENTCSDKSTFASKDYVYVMHLQSCTKHIGTQQNFTILTHLPPISMLKSVKHGKESLPNQYWVQRDGGETVGEEIYEISVFVPFILFVSLG